MGADEDDRRIGEELPRVDGRKYVTGAAEYANDRRLPDQLYLGLCRSEVGHAEIAEVDAAEASTAPGVEAVITGEDVERETEPTGIHDESYALATDRVRYYGEPVAAVAATSKRAADRAAQAVSVEYEPLDVVTDARAAIEDDAPTVHPALDDRGTVDGNVSQAFEQRIGDVDEGFADADCVFEETFRFPSIHGAPMEPHACVGQFHAGDATITLHTTTQAIHNHKQSVGTVFDVHDNEVQVVRSEVGGAFGNKLDLLPHEICAILLSKRTGAPVKAALSRDEQMEITKSSFAYVMDVRVGVRADGSIAAWEETILHDEGAYHERGLRVLRGMAANVRLLGYDVENVSLEGMVVYTNRTPAAPVRGTGIRQVTFAREVLLSRIADRLDVDPIEYRLDHSVGADDCPYTAPTGNVLHNTGRDRAVEAAKRSIGYRELRSGRPGKHVGVGVSFGYHVSSCRAGRDADLSTVDARIEEDGSVTVRTEACDMGTSCRTTITQVVADVLAVGVESIRIVDDDTQKTPPGDGSHSSRTMTMMGSAAHEAASTLKRNLLEVAAAVLERPPERIALRDGAATTAGGSRSRPVAELAHAVYRGAGSLPDDVDASHLQATATFDTSKGDVESGTEPADEHGRGNISIDYPFGCQIVAVSVDERTGAVTIEDHVVVDDAGTAVNPLVVEGQSVGGCVQAAGAALAERLTYDERTGRPLHSTLTDYGIPLATEAPPVDADYVEVPSPSTPGGWKGVGEGSFIVGPAAICNAVNDATGASFTELPITPEQIKRELDGSNPR